MPVGVTPPADLCVLRWWRIRSVFGAAELLEFVDEVVQFHGGAEGYFDEHGVIAGDAVAFDDVWDGLDEGIKVFFWLGSTSRLMNAFI